MRLMASFVLAFAVVGCDWMPGKPEEGHRHVRPEHITDFDTLYGMHCSGCHGAAGQGGPATPLAATPYQAWAGEGIIGRAIANGVPGTPMPAFSEEEGGTLTREQVGALVLGMSERWRGGEPPRLPGYGPESGDPESGKVVYARACAACHGETGRGGTAGAVFDDSYLALVSAQGLRTTIVVGRPDFGMPGFLDYAKPLAPREIDDVAAYVWSQRSEFPGQLPPDSATERTNAQDD